MYIQYILRTTVRLAGPIAFLAFLSPAHVARAQSDSYTYTGGNASSPAYSGGSETPRTNTGQGAATPTFTTASRSLALPGLGFPAGNRGFDFRQAQDEGLPPCGYPFLTSGSLCEARDGDGAQSANPYGNKSGPTNDPDDEVVEEDIPEPTPEPEPEPDTEPDLEIDPGGS